MHFVCEYKLHEFPNIGSIYTCQHYANQTDYSLLISTVSNHVEPLRNNLHVEGFSIRSQVWERIPRGIRNFFPNLEALEMVATRLREITWEDFEGLHRLKSLNFKGNKLQTLDGSTFQSLPQLHTISLSHNPLRHINLDTFNKSRKLKAIYLKNTSCIDQDKEGSTKEIKKYLDLLQIRCPPSLEMMQRKQVEQIAKKTDSLEKSISKVIQNIDKIENRLTNLEPALSNNPSKVKRKIFKKTEKSKE